MNAVTAVNKIRERAGVGDVSNEYLTTLDGFMSELRRERAVELAFEGHRFTDLRRWLLLDKEPYTEESGLFRQSQRSDRCREIQRPREQPCSQLQRRDALYTSFHREALLVPVPEERYRDVSGV